MADLAFWVGRVHHTSCLCSCVDHYTKGRTWRKQISQMLPSHVCLITFLYNNRNRAADYQLPQQGCASYQREGQPHKTKNEFSHDRLAIIQSDNPGKSCLLCILRSHLGTSINNIDHSTALFTKLSQVASLYTSLILMSTLHGEKFPFFPNLCSLTA